MALTGEEIRASLTRFVARWNLRPGYERGEAQTFLTELFACYGQDLSQVADFERFQEGFARCKLCSLVTEVGLRVDRPVPWDGPRAGSGDWGRPICGLADQVRPTASLGCRA